MIPSSRVFRAVVALLAVLAAGCGTTQEPQGAADERDAAKRPQAPNVDAVCKSAARDLRDPLAVERRLPESSVPTTSDPKLKREAERLRATRSVMQRVYDAARAKPQARYRRSLRSLIQELDDAELIARQEYNVAESETRLRMRWRRAQRQAANADLRSCARLRQPIG